MSGFATAPDEQLAGGSQLIFNVPAASPDWLVQCTRPAAPLSGEDIAARMGQTGLRTVEVDCDQAWIYPGDSAAPGIYALHHDLLTAPRPCLPTLLPCPTEALDPFIQRQLAGTRLSYEQPEDGALPAFALFEQPGQFVSVGGVNQVALDGPLAFLGAVAIRAGDGIDVETRWQVLDGPVERPFSLIGHVLDEQGAATAMADGLGLSPLALQTGDVLVQRHRFPQTSGDSVQFETGAYWLDDLSRWPVTGTPGAAGIVLTLPVGAADDQIAVNKVRDR
ncbi:MAG: hypothetical protein H6647_06605 [Anaerolineales bacterium]|nr:hypothetical protein [Anaerolineales bacterium]